MSKGYYVVKNSGSWGPLTAQEIRAMAQRGDLKREDGVRQADQTQVFRADSIAGLFPPAGAAPSSPAAARPSAAAFTAAARLKQGGSTSAVDDALENESTGPRPITPARPSQPGRKAAAGPTAARPAGGARPAPAMPSVTGSRHPVSDLLTTLVLLQLEDLSGRVDRGEISEERYQQQSALLFAQLRAAEASLLSGDVAGQRTYGGAATQFAAAPGTAGFLPAGFSPPSPVAYAAPPPPPDNSLSSTLALGAAALGGGALGYFAGRSNAPGVASSGPTSSGASTVATAAAAMPSREPEPSVWNDLISGSTRLAKGWNAWKSISNLVSGGSSSAAPHAAGITPESAARLAHPGGFTPESASQFANAGSPSEPIYDAQTVDGNEGVQWETPGPESHVAPPDDIATAELVDPPAESPLDTSWGNHFPETPAELPAGEPGGWFGGSLDGTDTSHVTTDLEGTADAGNWFGGGETDNVVDAAAGGDWFGGDDATGAVDAAADALGGVDVPDVDLTGLDGGGFEF